MLKTDQYKTNKPEYVTKTQQQKGLASFFLQNSKLISLIGEGWGWKSVTPPGDTFSPLCCDHCTAFTLMHSEYFQNPNDCEVTSPTRDRFCSSFFVSNGKTIGFEIQPKHRLWEMHIGRAWLPSLKDITDLSGAKDCTRVNSLEKNSCFKIYRGSPLGTTHWWSWIMQ